MLALGAQGLLDARPQGRIDRRHLRRTMNRIQLLQLDSVPIVARTQQLVLFSRLGPHRPGLLDEIAYKHDEWFEAWAHEASVLPVSTEPLLRWQKSRSEGGQTWNHLVRIGREEKAYVADVLAQVADRGPILARDLDDPRPQSGEWWGSRSMGTLALDWLFRIGAVGVRRVGNFVKEFDLLERIIPADILALPTPTEADAQRELLDRSAQALGVGTIACFADYFRLPIRDARQRAEELIEDGTLVAVSVPGWNKPTFRHRNAQRHRSKSGGVLVSPFDPVVWNRPRAAALFDFDYKLEIYTPKAERVYGYYVLPFLWKNQLVARVDLKTNRKESVLEVLGAFAEPGWDVDDASGRDLAEALWNELLDLAAFVGAERVGVSPNGDLAAALLELSRRPVQS